MPWSLTLQLAPLIVTLHLAHTALGSSRCNGNQCPVRPSTESKQWSENDQDSNAFVQFRAMQTFSNVNETIVEDAVLWTLYDAVAFMKLHAYDYQAVGRSRIQVWAVIGLLLFLVVILMFVNAPLSKNHFVWHVGLTITIATSWVAVSQFARLALADTDLLADRKTLVHLIFWANGTMWLFLGVPHVMQRLRTRISGSSMCDLWTSEVFGCRHAVLFWFIAFATNLTYIAALSFLSASLNTAVFSTSAVFTFGLTLAFLVEDSASTGFSFRSTGLRSVCIGLSMLGVVLISEAWHHTTASLTERLMGVGLSLFAALGTAVYQVTFKYTFGSRMTPEVVGLFLAYLGAMTFVCYGSVLFGGVAAGVIGIDLTAVPWTLILSASASSAVFNFLIKFGIVYASPVTVSLATQLGIPLNLGLDLLIVGASIDATQATGVVSMLVSFSLHVYLEQQKARPPS